MKRRELLRRLADAAGEAGLAWELVRQGSSHELWRCGGALVTVPRHREINDLTALGICRALETELGEGWWRT
jgi:mRNA interferase HicA